jgi:pimeloyl-ACP methyl ester carboxylesterase
LVTVRRFLALLLVSAALALATISLWIGFFIFRPAPLAETDPRIWGLEQARLVSIRSGGETLSGWWAPPRDAGGPVAMILHGRSANISSRAAVARRLVADGFGVLLFDYRGYGASSGRPSEQGLIEDGMAAYDWLRAEGIRSGQVHVIGQSLGNAPAARLAASRPVAALVLVSPFTSLPDAAADRFPWLPIRWLPWPRNRFDVSSAIAGVRAPLILVASRSDSMVPIGNSRRLAGLVPGARWIEVGQPGHDGLLTAVAASGLLTGALRSVGVRPAEP